MPTLVTIGINTPADGYNYYIGPCGGTLVAYPGNTTVEDVIQVDLEDPIYGFAGGETTYCYQICTVELSNADFDPGGGGSGSSGTSGSSNEVCCCEGQGTLNDPIPTPSDPPDRYGVGSTSCCGVINNWEFVLDSGSPAPQVGQVYLIYGTCYEITSIGVSTGPPVENPLQIPNGCADANCECSWQLLSCRSGANGPIVSFDNTYIPTTGQNGDIYTLNDVCYYFSPVPLSTPPTLTLQQSDVTSGGCDNCGDNQSETFVFIDCTSNDTLNIEVTGIPNSVSNDGLVGITVFNSGIGSPFPNSIGGCVGITEITESPNQISITYNDLTSSLISPSQLCSCPSIRVPALSCDGVTPIEFDVYQYPSQPSPVVGDAIYVPVGGAPGYPQYEDECYRVTGSASGGSLIPVSFNNITIIEGPTDCNDPACP